jgi:hypothetical protein
MDPLRKKLGVAARNAPLRLVRAEDGNRSEPLEGFGPTTVFLCVDHTDPLPIVAIDGSMNPLARFRSPLSAAQYLAAEQQRVRALPQAIVDQLNEFI